MTNPLCAACGTPFEFDHGPVALCGACLRERPRIERNRAVFVYNDISRDLAIGLKHRDRTHVAPALGAWLARTGRELVTDADLIAPVPLHRGRLWRRRFNQSALLARALCGAHYGRLRPDLLVRTRATPRQAGLDATARRRNMRGAFAFRPIHGEAVSRARAPRRRFVHHRRHRFGVRQHPSWRGFGGGRRPRPCTCRALPLSAETRTGDDTEVNVPLRRPLVFRPRVP